MKSDPVALALLHVAETRFLLESLLTSSESFDYQRAKISLKKLQRKERDLDKLQKQLEKAGSATAKMSAPTKMDLVTHAPAKGKICVVNFKAGMPAASSSL